MLRFFKPCKYSTSLISAISFFRRYSSDSCGQQRKSWRELILFTERERTSTLLNRWMKSWEDEEGGQEGIWMRRRLGWGRRRYPDRMLETAKHRHFVGDGKAGGEIGAREGKRTEQERDRRGDSVISLTSRIETSVRSLPQRFRFFTVDSDSAPVFFRMSSSVRATMLFLHDQSRASPQCKNVGVFRLTIQPY
jgi:hypothetical protein